MKGRTGLEKTQSRATVSNAHAWPGQRVVQVHPGGLFKMWGGGSPQWHESDPGERT